MSDTLPPPEQPGHSVLAATFAYNAWANVKLLDFCAGLSDAQMDSTTVGGYGTIRATLGHLVDAEVDYVSRVTGQRPATPPPGDAVSNFAVLCAAVQWANEELLTLSLSARRDTRVVEVWPEGTVRYPLADLLVQATSHAMEHRTQVAAILTALGLEPPDLSTWGWMEDRGAKEETLVAPS
ncbi:MAG TPA: DinB family protein [Chloroflexia bacterium]|nr:DinB family protein [Chloroflexia bacterium]